jgi:hypothetical protein
MDNESRLRTGETDLNFVFDFEQFQLAKLFGIRGGWQISRKRQFK